MVKKIVDPPKPYVWSKWPTWATNSEGQKRICNNPEEYERHTGIAVDEKGNPLPPTLEKVMAAGYTKEAAEKIVDEENWKYAGGYPPYGTNALPVPKTDGDGVPVTTPETAAEAFDRKHKENCVGMLNGIADAVATAETNPPTSETEAPKDETAEKSNLDKSDHAAGEGW